MSRLAVFNPWSLLPGFLDEDLFRTGNSSVFPPIDMYEENGKIIVKAQLPGFKPDDIDISFMDGLLKISGKTKVTKKEKSGKKYYINEIVEQSFVRTISLPEEVDVKKADASFKDGVLMITLPKKATKKLSEIKIKVK